jgi:asparagine synthase (glutamine-hydrolysing)
MCGIAGIIENTGTPDPSLIHRMTQAIQHRGPDAEGFFHDNGISLGHLRLSIIDLSSAANQPFPDHTGRYCIVFNGEIYNYKEIKAKIPDYPFHTTSDTEVLVAAYAKWGVDCLGHLRGMFAFAIWDKQEKELFIARDPMGVKPLYYFLDDHRLIFASEVRGILATGLVERKLDPLALKEFLYYQSVSSPYSAIAGVSQLEAGWWMKYRKGRLETKAYWDVTAMPQHPESMDAATTRKKIKDLMLQSIERRLIADVPVGAFLSGGIDSSAVVGLMAQAGVSHPNTFTISFEEKEYDESSYAALVAKKFNANHTRILLKPTAFLDELENALDAMDSPSGDGINTYVVSKAIRKNGMTVALSGVGGDELFAGYPFFAQYQKLRQNDWLWKMPGFVRRGAAGLLGSGGKKGRMKQILAAPTNFIDSAYPIFRQILAPEYTKDLLTMEYNSSSPTVVQRELSSRKTSLQRLPLLSQVSAAEYLGYTQHTLLKDTDQMSMAVALEVREPFFDQDLVSYVLAIPDELKTPVYPKSLLVESLKPLLPDEIVHRKKQGFLFPWNTWLKNELYDFCHKRVQAMAQRPFIDGKNLLSHWDRFQKGDANVRWSEIWLFVVLEYWLEKNEIS